MQKLMGKPWSSWNLPEQPTELDLRKLREAYQPPEQYKTNLQATPLPSKYMPLFGTHPGSDFLSITKCPACGWLMKVQHANKHYLRDSRGSIVCKDSDLAIFGSKVLGKASHPVGEIKETYSKRITLRIPPQSHGSSKSSHGLRGATSSINDIGSTKSRSGSSAHTSSKTDYLTHSSQYRSRSHSQIHSPSASSYMPKSRSGGNVSSSASHGSTSVTSSTSVSKGKSGKTSHTTTSSWPSLRSNAPSKSTSSHKLAHNANSGSYTLSIPSEDMGQNESVEDLLMSNIGHPFGTSKHTVHIIATSNSTSKTKLADPDFPHVKFISDVPEKRIKLDSSHSRNSDHHHKSSHGSSHDGHSANHDTYSKSKSSKHSSSSVMNGSVSSHSHGLTSESTKKSKSSLSKNDLGSSSKHHLRSTAPSTIVTISKPAVAGLTSTGHSRSHGVGVMNPPGAVAPEKEKDKEKERTNSPKKKKRKRDKDEPRKIIPLKDRYFIPDKHCGVCVPGSNLPCKRSLTCKTHSVALRRAVTGRSQSFDALLAAHKLAKNEEKNFKVKEVIEEIVAVKPKKKKPSGTNSSNGAAPNDFATLAVVSEPPAYARSGSPDIEVIAVKAKSKPATTIPDVEMVHCYSKKYKACPLVYPYRPDTQAKFELIWYDPEILDRHPQLTAEEKHKFAYLLRHFKNPHFMTCDVTKPLVKNFREKRNVFSNWNPAQKPVEDSHRNIGWTPAQSLRQQVPEEDDDVQFIVHIIKK